MFLKSFKKLENKAKVSLSIGSVMWLECVVRGGTLRSSGKAVVAGGPRLSLWLPTCFQAWGRVSRLWGFPRGKKRAIVSSWVCWGGGGSLRCRVLSAWHMGPGQHSADGSVHPTLVPGSITGKWKEAEGPSWGVASPGFGSVCRFLTNAIVP